MADSAASVGSVIFVGVFAMSVASPYAQLRPAAGMHSRRAMRAFACNRLRIPPSGSRPVRAGQTFHCRLAILSACQTERNALLRCVSSSLTAGSDESRTEEQRRRSGSRARGSFVGPHCGRSAAERGATAISRARIRPARRQAPPVRPRRSRSASKDNRILCHPRLGGTMGAKPDQA